MGLCLRYQNRVIALGPRPIAIGRADNCELRVDYDPLISRRHAIFVANGAGASVEDLDSRNGVYVNGTRVKGPTPIKSGDRILVGSQEIFVIDQTDKTVVTPREKPDDVEREGARTLASAPEPMLAPDVDFVIIQGREYAVIPKADYLKLRQAAEAAPPVFDMPPTSRRAGPMSKRAVPKKKK